MLSLWQRKWLQLEAALCMVLAFPVAGPVLGQTPAGSDVPPKPLPPDIVQATAASLPQPLRRFRSPNEPRVAAAEPPAITYPPAGVRIDLGLRDGGLILLAKALCRRPGYQDKRQHAHDSDCYHTVA